MIILKAMAIVAFLHLVHGATFTDEEEAALAKFRPMVKSLLYKDYMHRDDYLIRWLRARKLDLGRAKEMLEKSIKWRKSENIDSIKEEDFSTVEKCIPVHHSGHDKRGRPITHCPMGAWDIRKCALSGHMPKMIRYIVRHYMEGPQDAVINAVDPTGQGNVTQFYSIMDLNGFNLRQGGCLACLPLFAAWAANYENNYPALNWRYHVINSPRVFDVVLNVARPILTKATNEAILLYSHDKSEWQPVLTKQVASDQLPAIFGGKRKANLPEDNKWY